eukprot:7711638-Lingulodinium_polyedra.AAC.1
MAPEAVTQAMRERHDELLRQRACSSYVPEYGPVREVLASSKLGARQKAIVRAMASDDIWTGVRLLDRGYLVEGACCLCGGRDDLFHRLYRCQHEQ